VLQLEILDMASKPYIPNTGGRSDAPKSFFRRVFGFAICIIVYLFFTYLLGSLGANIPPNHLSFFVILPAIPGIVVFHVIGGVLAYLIFMATVSICTWLILGKSKWVAIAFAGCIGIVNGYFASRCSWLLGP
jgi:hypothetical protein